MIAERMRKLAALRAAGVDPYPAQIKRSHTISELLDKFKSLEQDKKEVAVVGRVMGLRNQGGLLFADLRDETGQVQIVAKRNEVADFELLRDTLDLSDFLEVRGVPFTTQRGEQSVGALSARIVVKSLRTLPSSWYGLQDVETRLRQRYLDFLLNPDLKDLFAKKFKFWAEFRAFLTKAGFQEVEMPVLEPIPGGAEAEPFLTHHKALDWDFYLRISLELPLKKLLVAGFEKVFEIGRIFRNEGIDAEHLQDYTQLEFYWAYADYNDLMKFVEKMYSSAIKNVFGTLTLPWNRKKIDWTPPWPKVQYYDLFKKFTGLDLKTVTRDELYMKALKENLKPELELGRGRLIDLLFKKMVRPTLVQPVFLVNPPVDIEPLAKRLSGNPDKVARFQVVACQTELGKGFSELNDPQDQRDRFTEQMDLRAKGDKEAQMLDEDFLVALEHGMPPAAGFGVSERLFSVLAGKPIRELVFFPPMRPRDTNESGDRE